jgi:hypothetical protein
MVLQICYSYPFRRTFFSCHSYFLHLISSTKLQPWRDLSNTANCYAAGICSAFQVQHSRYPIRLPTHSQMVTKLILEHPSVQGNYKLSPHQKPLYQEPYSYQSFCNYSCWATSTYPASGPRSGGRGGSCTTLSIQGFGIRPTLRVNKGRNSGHEWQLYSVLFTMNAEDSINCIKSKYKNSC